MDQKQWTDFRNNLIYKLDNYLNNSKIKDIKNEVLKFSCKNGSCNDYVDIDGTHCEDCKKGLKNCKCGEEFWTDEDNKYCDDCSDSDSDTDDENSY